MKKYLGLVVAAWICFAGAANAEEEAAADTEELVELEIELPDAFFGGTPIEYFSAVLEPKEFKPRPPFMAPKGTTLISGGKSVTSSASALSGNLEQITDGNKDYVKSSMVELPGGAQWVQVDLGSEHQLAAVLLWHFHEGERVYFDIIVQASNDPAFENEVTTLYNNDFDNSAGLGLGSDKEYYESNRGRLIDAKGAKARYIRAYSQGNTDNDMNHYIEIEAFGKPVE